MNEVKKEKRPSDWKRFVIPDVCPVCGSKTEREKDTADINCTSPNCPAQLERHIINFVGRDAMDIKGFGTVYIGKEVAEFYVSMRYKPTVILCFNDDIAFGTIEYLKKLGIRVPDDVSVMGIDGLFTRDKYTPKLTTVNMYPELQGAKCAEILIDILNGFKYKYIYKFKVSILEGESVKKL